MFVCVCVCVCVFVREREKRSFDERNRENTIVHRSSGNGKERCELTLGTSLVTWACAEGDSRTANRTRGATR